MAARVELSESEATIAKSLALDEIPIKLRCAVCNGLAHNAARLPCCAQNFCEDCQSSLAQSCPLCNHHPVAPTDMKANIVLRKTVQQWLKSLLKVRDKAFQDVGISEPPSFTTSTPLVKRRSPTTASQTNGQASSNTTTAEEGDITSNTRPVFEVTEIHYVFHAWEAQCIQEAHTLQAQQAEANGQTKAATAVRQVAASPQVATLQELGSVGPQSHPSVRPSTAEELGRPASAVEVLQNGDSWRLSDMNANVQNGHQLDATSSLNQRNNHLSDSQDGSDSTLNQNQSGSQSMGMSIHPEELYTLAQMQQSQFHYMANIGMGFNPFVYPPQMFGGYGMGQNIGMNSQMMGGYGNVNGGWNNQSMDGQFGPTTGYYPNGGNNMPHQYKFNDPVPFNGQGSSQRGVGRGGNSYRNKSHFDLRQSFQSGKASTRPNSDSSQSQATNSNQANAGAANHRAGHSEQDTHNASDVGARDFAHRLDELEDFDYKEFDPANGLVDESIMGPQSEPPQPRETMHTPPHQTDPTEPTSPPPTSSSVVSTASNISILPITHREELTRTYAIAAAELDAERAAQAAGAAQLAEEEETYEQTQDHEYDEEETEQIEVGYPAAPHNGVFMDNETPRHIPSFHSQMFEAQDQMDPSPYGQGLYGSMPYVQSSFERDAYPMQAWNGGYSARGRGRGLPFGGQSQRGGFSGRGNSFSEPPVAGAPTGPRAWREGNLGFGRGYHSASTSMRNQPLQPQQAQAPTTRSHVAEVRTPIAPPSTQHATQQVPADAEITTIDTPPTNRTEEGTATPTGVHGNAPAVNQHSHQGREMELTNGHNDDQPSDRDSRIREQSMDSSQRAGDMLELEEYRAPRPHHRNVRDVSPSESLAMFHFESDGSESGRHRRHSRRHRSRERERDGHRDRARHRDRNREHRSHRHRSDSPDTDRHHRSSRSYRDRSRGSRRQRSRSRSRSPRRDHGDRGSRRTHKSSSSLPFAGNPGSTSSRDGLMANQQDDLRIAGRASGLSRASTTTSMPPPSGPRASFPTGAPTAPRADRDIRAARGLMQRLSGPSSASNNQSNNTASNATNGEATSSRATAPATSSSSADVDPYAAAREAARQTRLEEEKRRRTGTGGVSGGSGSGSGGMGRKRSRADGAEEGDVLANAPTGPRSDGEKRRRF